MGQLRNSESPKQFWMYVVATIILAVITLGIWDLWTHKEQARKRNFCTLKRVTPHEAKEDVE
ncbi:hypothetical protein PDIG_14730 [Penicillium digitatum PHI26]|uniref:Uncharacterized protein n=2 Tax=Penicillium digitatum TaxID=36651 RepID=K9GS53_PEND2|nr:hypothetical protein PDIP_02220 [Penicillium digitatum Pd1]EKV17458.1 hypothetical protein PDIG_14730 [Penicillium digitatum PHI26]EKV21907.1 hypothetical protein PDIP_02220 [Penicillium digitatum Pd1]